jgi:2-polyprenyl-6-hydroxyphenyl methylase/3-demethylubiquinone-9 3-methyltransferase
MPTKSVRKQLAALYKETPLLRLYTALKLLIIPFEEFARYLPKQGKILEVGCGYGYVANYLSLESLQRDVIGHDVAADRVQVAQRTIGERRNIEFFEVDSRDMPVGELDGVVIADVLHHVPYAEQGKILADLYDKLKPGGVLVMRETDKKIRLRYFLFNYLLEWVLYLGTEKLKFRKAAEWSRLLQSLGYEVRSIRPNPPWFPYLTATFVCVKRGTPANREGSNLPV